MRARALSVLITSATLTMVGGPAHAQTATVLTATAGPAPGWVGLRVTGPARATVTLAEWVDGVAQPFASAPLGAGSYSEQHALAWRCDRRRRALVATVTAADGTRSEAQTTVVTPSCAHRFTLRVHPSTAVRVGARLAVSLRD